MRDIFEMAPEPDQKIKGYVYRPCLSQTDKEISYFAVALLSVKISGTNVNCFLISPTSKEQTQAVATIFVFKLSSSILGH